MTGISMAITKTLYSVMATPLLLMSSMLTAQVPTSGAPKTGGAVSQPPVAAETNDSAEIAQRLTNPLAAMISVPLQNWFDASGRTTQAGLSDSTESVFLSPVHTKSIIWGAGPAFLVPTATNGLLSTRKFGVGPTAVVLNTRPIQTPACLLVRFGP